MDEAYLFNRGDNYMSYKFLGDHTYKEDDGNEGVVF